MPPSRQLIWVPLYGAWEQRGSSWLRGACGGQHLEPPHASLELWPLRRRVLVSGTPGRERSRWCPAAPQWLLAGPGSCLAGQNGQGPVPRPAAMGTARMCWVRVTTQRALGARALVSWVLRSRLHHPAQALAPAPSGARCPVVTPARFARGRWAVQGAVPGRLEPACCSAGSRVAFRASAKRGGV